MTEQVSISKKPSKELIQEIADETGLQPAFVEKDWYSTQLIALIAEQNKHQPFQAIFSGGTSLVKGHALIERFSEDLDFIVSVPVNETASQGQRRKFRHNIIEHINNYPHYYKVNASNVKRGNNHRFFKTSINYPKIFEHSSLRSHMQLEMTFCEPRVKPIITPIQSIICQTLHERPEAEIACVSPLETAGDKISALSWRVLVRDRTHPNDDPTIVRHLHDIAALEKTINSNFNEFFQITNNSLSQDKQRRVRQKLSMFSNNKILSQALEKLERDPMYEKEYEEFVMTMSYAKDDKKINFKNTCSIFSGIIKQINSLSVGQCP